MPDDLMNGAGHLPPEVEFGYERRLLTPAEIRRVHDHLAACASCRGRVEARLDVGAMVADVRAELDARPLGAGRSGGPWLVLAAALTLAVGAVWLARRSAEPSAAGAPEDAAVAAALRTGTLPLPAFLGELSPPREVLMGGGEPASRPPAVLSPAATAVLSDRPRFSWGGLSAGDTVEVRVFTLEGDAVLSSPPLDGQAWTPDHPLVRGRDYQWQLAVLRGGERTTLPAPPGAPPRFRVLAASDENDLRRLAAAHPGDRVFLAVELARLGAVEGARMELDAALRAEPGRADVRRLCESLVR